MGVEQLVSRSWLAGTFGAPTQCEVTVIARHTTLLIWAEHPFPLHNEVHHWIMYAFSCIV